ncbi:YhcH/YjgK/YiaL family protein [Paenibacillus periandrae]|uniref:YhcH/YjgK/YiaL family protein n=1 Tax=Paenibacillus periandrae TaxID=1761741 RepID=UPI001F08F4B6|nr:YhcH/YjgK/YiaL family protein [Paenibacillus periandrae]
MIIGSMSLWESQAAFEHKIIVSAIEELNAILKPNAAAGCFEIKGDQLYATIMEFDTKPMQEQLAEKHEKYIDVHYLIEGEETIGWSALRDDAAAAKPYDSEQDYVLYEPSADELLLQLKPGMYAVFFPNDIHRPGMGQQTKIKKAVVKIHVDLFTS